MSLGQPDLYIGGQKMQAGKGDPRPTLAGVKIDWGNDSRFSFDPPASLSGQLLIRGEMPGYLHVGAPVGLIDPVSSRTLFAGTMQPLRAVPDERIAGAMRVTFTATAPKAELEQHTVLSVDWPLDETANSRRARIGSTLPRGWGYGGATGWDWVRQGHQRYQNILWLTLAERYARGNKQRLHDVSTYVPGAGLIKRMYFTDERPKNTPLPRTDPGELGKWVAGAPAEASGTAVLPVGAVSKEIEWEKTPEDVITAVQVTTWGMSLIGSNDADESKEHEWPLDFTVDNSALQDAYGYRALRVETALSPQNLNALMPAHESITKHWTDTQTDWRPTTLQLPDSRRLATSVLLNLLAVNSRHMAAVSVPAVPGLLPNPIRAYVLGGSATWTGKKWTTDLTLGRMQP